MASQSIIELMPPASESTNTTIEIEDLDLSVLFPSEKPAAPEFLWEINSIFVEMRKDRESIKEYNLQLAQKLDEQLAIFSAQLEAKEGELKRCLEEHRQKEQEWAKKLQEIRSELESLDSTKQCISITFSDMIDRIMEIMAGGKEFLDSIKQNEMNEAKVESNTVQQTVTILSDSEEEPTHNYAENMHQSHAPIAVTDKPQSSHATKDDSNMTDDESCADNNNGKENVAPTPMDGMSIGISQTGDEKTAKAVRTKLLVRCKWCGETILKKMLSQHKWDVHKVPPKDKSAGKMERAQKRKIDDDDQYDSDVSISSVVRPSMVPLRQIMVKPKKAKNMATSSPV